jgi:hypothetical protein
MPEQFGSSYFASSSTGLQYEWARKAHFEVDIQGIDLILLAMVAGLPKLEFDKGEIAHFNDVIKYAKNPRFGDLTVDFIDSPNPNCVSQIQTWVKQIYDPNTSKMGFTSRYKRQGKVYLYDAEGGLIRTWTCKGLFPLNSPVPSDTYEAGNHDPVLISMAFSVDRATLDGAQSANLLG